MSNTNNQQTLAILDGQFHVHTLLTQSQTTRVYRATHSSGTDVAVKIHWQEGAFFDELARLYALDHSPYFASCLYNYPPLAASGKAIPLEGELAALLEGEGADQIGVLVLEWVAGPTLHEFLLQADEMEKVDGLLEVSLALRDLMSAGFCHGSIDPQSVLLERETHEVKLVGLGADPEWWSERDPSCPDKAIKTDIRAFAEHFLRLPRKTGRAFRRFRKQCLGNAVPSLEEVHQQIKALRQRHMPRHNLEILFGFFKPLHVLSWVVVIFGASMLINRLMGDGDAPIQKRRADIIADASKSESLRLEQLRRLYAESESDAFRELLAGDIAQINRARPHVVLSERDASKPIAVMAFRDNPIVVGRKDVVRVGDWVEVEKRFGYVAKIEFNRIKIVFEDAFSWHLFARPKFFRGLHFGEEVVIVWENENNLERLLSVLADHFKLDFKPLVGSGANTAFPAGGKLSGMFRAHGGLAPFIEELNEAVDVRLDAGSLIYQSNASSAPIYYKFPVVIFKDRPVEVLSDLYSSVLGVPVNLAPALEGEKISITRYNVTWQELLRDLNIAYSINWKDETFSILLAPDKRLSGNF